MTIVEMMENDFLTEDLYVNPPQALAEYIDAQHIRAIWARGTGKSDGLIAPRVRRCVEAMPFSMGGIVAMSFTQMLTRTLPAMVRGLQRRGWVLNRDFTIREQGPKLGPNRWELPITPPLSWANAIHFRNGAAALLISQRNPGSANGLDLDWIAGDEAKFIKKEPLDEEVMPAMRGNRDRWGHLSLHHSTCFATDMPTTPSGRWILEEENLAKLPINQDAITCILSIQMEIGARREAILAGGLKEATVRVYESQIRSMERELNILRKKTYHFSLANAYDNIHVLGVEWIENMRKLLPDFVFRTSILNMRLDRVDRGFYPDLDDDRHTYAPDESHAVSSADGLDLVETQWNDCRKDGDLIEGVRLEIAPDFGDSFNCFVVGQLFGENLNFLNQIYVKHPGKIKDLVRMFDGYYRAHKPKRVRFHCDHTMKGQDAARSFSFIEETERELKKLGWHVERNYVGLVMSHHERYILWDRAFRMDPTMPLVQFNRDNCEPTLLAMRLAGARTTKRGFEKDKRPEQRDDVDQAEATHLTDAADLLLVGVIKSKTSASSAGVSMLFG